MVIGVDCSRAFVSERTGTENYSYFLLKELLQVSSEHRYRLYLRFPVQDSEEFIKRVREALPNTKNFDLVEIRQKRLWTQIGLALELRKHPVDVLFVPAHTLPLLRPRDIKTVVTIHDLGYEYLPQYHQFPHKHWLTFFTEYAVHEADRLIAVSEATKADLLTKLKADEHKVSVIYEGFIPRRMPVKPIEEVLQKYDLRNPYIIFVGTVQPRKNLVRMIEAFSQLKKESRFKEYEFVIVGKKGWLSEDIYGAPSRFGVEDSVKFLGYVNDEETTAIWSRAALTFYATSFEGFGIPILDSQSLGVPVVTSDKQPYTEVGGPDNACEYVNETSVEHMKAGLQNVLGDDERRVELSRNGIVNAQRFSWQKAAQQTLNVLESV